MALDFEREFEPVEVLAASPLSSLSSTRREVVEKWRSLSPELQSLVPHIAQLIVEGMGGLNLLRKVGPTDTVTGYPIDFINVLRPLLPTQGTEQVFVIKSVGNDIPNLMEFDLKDFDRFEVPEHDVQTLVGHNEGDIPGGKAGREVEIKVIIDHPAIGIDRDTGRRNIRIEG